MFADRQRVTISGVALLAEGVDRNMVSIKKEIRAYVALLAEGVDRNSSSDIS